MGRYVPPEFEGTTSGNALHGKKALGNRANKSAQGILTVRFEMPYPIWCTTCPKPTIIGQGVRFNAEKKKVGNYYSTPIWSFRMKHAACGGWIEIRTDPKNTAYAVVEGARARDLGLDKEGELEGGVPILTEAEREERRANAFAALEGKVEDRQRLERAKERIEEIQEVQDRMWDDPYARNRALRAQFRAGRKERERQATIAGALQDKMSLAIELVPENEGDVKRASFIEFGTVDHDLALTKAIAKPLFMTKDSPTPPKPSSKSKTSASRKLKAAQLLEKHKADLAEEIRGNTRVKTDPFLNFENAGEMRAPSWKARAVGVKRKREREVGDGEGEGEGERAGKGESGGEAQEGSVNVIHEKRVDGLAGLVDYDSE